MVVVQPGRVQIVELVEVRWRGRGELGGQVLLRAAADPGEEAAVGPDVTDLVRGGVRARIGGPRVAGQDGRRPGAELGRDELGRLLLGQPGEPLGERAALVVVGAISSGTRLYRPAATACAAGAGSSGPPEVNSG
jgi:hypothetical protein